MKKTILLCLLLSLLYSCKKDENPEVLTRGKATFKIGTVEKVYTKANSFNNGVLALGDSTDELVSMFFPIPTDFPTTYDMDTKDIVTASYVVNGKNYDATNGILGIGQKGSLLIKISASSDAKISGTFQFTAFGADDEQITITEGVFEEIPDL